MTGEAGSLLARIAEEGARAAMPPPATGKSPDPADVAAALERASTTFARDAGAGVTEWEATGGLHDLVVLDATLQALGRRVRGPFTGRRKKRLCAVARGTALRTRHRGALELAVAVLGAFGTKEDVPILETVARHPEMTLHGATALAMLEHWHGRAALLRLLSATSNDSRETVIDRLLPHAGQPAVRLALVRDALEGLDPELAHELARDIAEHCRVREWLGERRVPDDVRAACRRLLERAADDEGADA